MNFLWFVQTTQPILSRLNVVNSITKAGLAGFGMYFPIFGDQGMNSGTFERMKDVVVTGIIRGRLGCVAGT